MIEDQPKSRAGVRDVVLPGQAVDELREHLERWARLEPDDYVFTSPEGMPLERNNFGMRVWLPATAMLGLEGLKLHELRHPAGTPGSPDRRPVGGAPTGPRTARKALWTGPFSVVGTGVDPVTSRFSGALGACTSRS